MTYRELIDELLSSCSEEQLDCDVTVYSVTTDEYQPGYFEIPDSEGRLAEGCPVIRFDY